MTLALVLAGGLGSRLGGVDKAFIDLDGKPLISHLLARLGPQVDKIAISANGDASRFDAFGLDVIPDGPLSGFGPLAGLAAGLEWAGQQNATSLVTVPVDTPFIPLDLVERLGPAPSVAAFDDRQHHLVAHWPVAALPSLKNFLQTGAPYKVRDFLGLCAARQVVFAGAADPFLNINTAAELDTARARIDFPPKAGVANA